MKSLIRFFTSIRLAIALLIILTVVSVIGTLIPQGRSAAEYAARYGGLAPFLIRLQLTTLYHSAWFMALLGMFALNIMVCTWTRFLPKWRRVFHPRPESEAKNLAALKINTRLKSYGPSAETRSLLETSLRSAHYRLRSTSPNGPTSLLARKRLAGLFGSDVVHLGLLVLLAGGIVTGFTGFRAELPLDEGQTVDVPRAGFALRLDKFETVFYPDGNVQAWKSTLTVLEDKTPVRTQVVAVNRPLTHKGYSFYQMSYGFNWDSPTLEIVVRKKADPAFLRTLTLKPGGRLPLGDAEGTEIATARFLPDFILGENNQPENRSLQPNNPAVLMEGWVKGQKVFEGWVFANYPDFAQMHKTQTVDLQFEFKSFKTAEYSVIEAAKDPGVPLIWLGCALGMAGLALAFYWPTWEIRAVLEESQGRTEITAGGIAAKSRDRFAAEFESVFASLRSPK